METAKKKELIESLLTRGVENIIPNREDLEKVLLSDKKLNVYMGIDATATRIHLGHAFNLRKLRILTELGHNVTFLVGDFTAKVGDTSDKETERPILSDEQIAQNLATFQKQAAKFLDFEKVSLKFNSEWLSKLTFADVLKLTQNFSLNDFISRDLIKNRLVEGKRISLPETLYPIMQGFDSYYLDTDLQIGATDQTFNMQAGRTLLKNLKNKDSFVMASGYLPGTDGRKMSKTWGNAIWVEDSPEEIYGKVMSISDEVIVTYFLMATNVPAEKIEEIKKRLSSGENPMSLKKELAKEMVSELWGDEGAVLAEEHFKKTVVEKEAGEDAVEYEVRSKSLGVISDLNGASGLANILVDTGLVGSRSEFKRLLDEGAIYIDEKRIEKNQDKIDLHDGINVIRVGKRKYLKLKV